ncbi:EAL and HDOD domain-containing protein [Nitriliruptor alkaliphilus]|uniref:EAL and HDOD domain-containing protein n=1 Tax=Nitriliruptor alkaliphilus TaxID=427918 RepID=UPI0006972BB8|nr:HDOD domain-containing protein [Nitriliruptor alkaliphilus]
MTGVLGELLLARQPILDVDVEVVGYQLLHRDVDVPRQPRAASASAALVVDGLLTLGRRDLTGGADAWITVTEELLRSGTLLDLPTDGIVLGLPAGAVPDEQLRTALHEHRTAGYRICLDDVAVGDPRIDVLDLTDHARVHVAPDGGPSLLPLIGELAARGSNVVAAGVADYEQLERVRAVGAELVQGLFWTRPRDVRALRPLQFAPGHLQLLDALGQHEVDLRAVEELIRSDITLTDRFLRLIRRVAGYRKVASIHDGLVLLGVRAVQRWVSLLTLGRLAEDAPVELVTLASARARSCELLEEMRGGDRRLEAFTLGMFSVLGPEGRLSAETLDVLPVSDEVREALEHGRGALRPLLDVELATEQAAWQRAEDGGRAIGIEPTKLAQANVAALNWSAAVCA